MQIWDIDFFSNTSELLQIEVGPQVIHSSSSDLLGRRSGDWSVTPPKIVCEGSLWGKKKTNKRKKPPQKSCKVYSLTMMSMARGGWSMQLGWTDLLDPLFMLAGVLSGAGASMMTEVALFSTIESPQKLPLPPYTCPKPRPSFAAIGRGGRVTSRWSFHMRFPSSKAYVQIHTHVG